MKYIYQHMKKLDTYRFTAITKFVDFMNITQSKGKQQVKFAYIFYDPNDTFKNKFDQLCIKPFTIDLIYEIPVTKVKRLHHDDIVNIFNGQLIIKYKSDTHPEATAS